MATQTPLVNDWLRSAYSMELGLIPILEDQIKYTQDDPAQQKMIHRHLQQTREHALMLKDRLERLGEVVSNIQPASAIATLYGRPNGDRRDPLPKDVLIGFVTESLEVASYKALVAAANVAGDRETVRMAQEILYEEEQMVRSLEEGFPKTTIGVSVGATTSGDAFRVARASFDAFNVHDLGQWSQYQASDFRGEAPGAGALRSSLQAREYLQRFITAFPDLHLEIERTVAQGDSVVFDWLSRGTHTGPLAGFRGITIPPTGKSVQVRGSTTYEVKNSKITRTWIHWDMLSLLDQLGALPAPSE